VTKAQRIALISATPVAMKPAEEAIIAELPGAEIWHLLDDRLLADAERAGAIDGKLRARMETLIRVAVAGGAHAVLLTCSQYGSVARECGYVSPHPISLSGSDDDAFTEVIELAPRNLLIVASLSSAAADTKRRLGRSLTDAGIKCTIDAHITSAPGRDGDRAGPLLQLVEGTSDSYDAILLAQYSLAALAPILTTELNIPVVSPPAAAATALRERLTGHAR